MSLQACYRRSAYFEYYEDSFAPFYEQKTTFLFDYNQQLLEQIIKLLKLKTGLNYTDTFEASYPQSVKDFRSLIHPKKEADFEQKPYFQVFEERKGFLKNLSIVDLLFNQGPHAVNYL
jgi:hypothetical protein